MRWSLMGQKLRTGNGFQTRSAAGKWETTDEIKSVGIFENENKTGKKFESVLIEFKDGRVFSGFLNEPRLYLKCAKCGYTDTFREEPDFCPKCGGKKTLKEVPKDDKKAHVEEKIVAR